VIENSGLEWLNTHIEEWEHGLFWGFDIPSVNLEEIPNDDDTVEISVEKKVGQVSAAAGNLLLLNINFF